MGDPQKRRIRIRLPVVSEEMRRRAIELRHNMTAAERVLWAALRTVEGIGRFQRQRVIGNYIADFASLETGLVIEVDGSQHLNETGVRRDQVRDAFLKYIGFKVLRFNDADVLRNVAGVMQVIMTEVNERRNEE